MATLMAKFKMKEWETVDETDPNSDLSEQEQKNHMLAEYKEVFGQGWLFKWSEEISEEVFA